MKYPLFKGGQGHTTRDVVDSGSFLMVLAMVCLVIVALLYLYRGLFTIFGWWM